MANTIAKILGNDPGDAFDSVLSGISRAISFSSNIRLERDSKLNRFINMVGIAASIGSFVRSGYELIQDVRDDRKEYTIKISRGGSLYEAAQELALETVADTDKTNLIARTVWDEEEGRYILSAIFDDDLEQRVTVRGHEVLISLSVYTNENTKQEAQDTNMALRRKTTYTKTSDLYITCYSVKARDAVLAELSSRISKSTVRESQLYSARDWGSFSSKTMAKRSPESVVLADEQMDRILEHFKVFLDNEQAYADLGIPYHTGALFYGPPGTGKTSITSVLSDKFGLDVYHISLNSINGDTALFELFSEIESNSIVLFEDVDVSPSASDRDSDEKERVTMSGLLNVLDGNLTPHGVISILTTNHKDALDPAVIRPGRVDLIEHFSYMDQSQLERTCKHFMGYIPENLPKITRDHKVSSADIVGVFRANIVDIPSTEGDLIMFLRGKVETSFLEEEMVSNV